MDLESNQAHDIFSAIPQSVGYVELSHIHLPTSTVGDLIFLWSRLPHLQTFILSNDMQIGGPDIQEEYMCHGCDTRLFPATEIRLFSKISHFDVIADWMCSQNVPARLCACVLVVTTEYIGPTAKLLRDAGPALEKIQFHLSTTSKPVDGLEVLCACDLRQCTALRELQFSCSVFDERPDGNTFVYISQILLHIRAPSLRTLVFTFWGYDSGNLGRAVAHLDGVADALSRNCAFKDLGRVVVRLSGMFSPRVNEAVYASVRTTFKRFEEKGLLTCEAANDLQPTKWMT